MRNINLLNESLVTASSGDRVDRKERITKENKKKKRLRIGTRCDGEAAAVKMMKRSDA